MATHDIQKPSIQIIRYYRTKKTQEEEEAEVLNSWMSKSHIVSMCVFPIDPLTLITYWYCIGCYLRMMAGYANAWLLLLPPYTFSIVSWVTQWFLNDVILRRARPRRLTCLMITATGSWVRAASISSAIACVLRCILSKTLCSVWNYLISNKVIF